MAKKERNGIGGLGGEEITWHCVLTPSYTHFLQASRPDSHYITPHFELKWFDFNDLVDNYSDTCFMIGFDMEAFLFLIDVIIFMGVFLREKNVQDKVLEFMRVRYFE